MKYRYFKGDITQQPLQSLNKEWLESRELRNKKLEAVFNTIPFYDEWLGDEESIYAIIVIKIIQNSIM